MPHATTSIRHLSLALTCLGAMALSGLAAGGSMTGQSKADDQIIASFERAMQREPVPGRPTQRRAIGQDFLYKAMNEVHWTPDAAQPDRKGDGERNDSGPANEP